MHKLPPIQKCYKVGDTTYTVEEWARAKMPVDQESGRPILGACLFEERRIILLRNLAPQRKHQVLFHELIHAALFEANKADIKLDLGYFEEPIVERLDKILFGSVLQQFGFSTTRRP